MSSYKIRKAQRTDQYIINNLIRSILADYGFHNIENDEDLANIQSAYSHQSECFLVVKYNDNIIATIALKRKTQDYCELGRLYIHNDHRGRGLGKMLMAKIMDFARLKGFKKMVLETHTKNVEAVGMYKKYGFSEIEPYSGKTRDFCNIAFEKCLLTHDPVDYNEKEMVKVKPSFRHSIVEPL